MVCAARVPRSYPVAAAPDYDGAEQREWGMTSKAESAGMVIHEAPGGEMAARPESAYAMVRQSGPRTSEDIDVIARELAMAQVEFGDVTKTRKAVITKGATRYEYMYANLADVTAVVMPALKAHGIVPMQIPMGDRVYVRLLHGPSGQWIEGGLPLVLPDYGADVQRLGSALTYMRRYLLCMMLGIVAGDEDDDGNAAMPGYRSPDDSARPASPPQAARPPRSLSPDIDAAMGRADDGTATNADVAILLGHAAGDVRAAGWSHAIRSAPLTEVPAIVAQLREREKHPRLLADMLDLCSRRVVANADAQGAA